jgi:hypothetical protein
MSKEQALELLNRSDVYLTQDGRQELMRIIEEDGDSNV